MKLYVNFAKQLARLEAVGWAVKCETAPSCGEDKWLESTLNAAFKFRFNDGCGKRTHRII